MADSINTINVGGIDKEVEDTVARSSGTNANSRCTTLESNVSNLAARVEEIIAPTGEAPSPEEILDARVGYDNVIYPTLGNAIRTQIEKKSNELKKTCQVISTVLDNDDTSIMNFCSAATNDLFDLSDKEGNILVAVDENGELKTPNFDSGEVSESDYLPSPIDYSLAIKDENGNIAFAFVKGLAITNQRLFGKKLAIVGDSISTFSGWIPSGYATYYPHGDLDTVEETWWYKLVKELGFNLIRNASWSGSRVSGDSEGNAYCACSDARIDALVGDNNETPDIILCYISTNDWANGIPVGSFTDKDEIPSDGVFTEISKAYALMLYKIRTRYPLAQVYCITNLEGRRANGDTIYPIVNSQGETIHDVNHAIAEIAHIFGCHVIDLNVSGIHFWNVDSYTVDGTLHPNIAGAEIIKEVTKQTLINSYHNM